MLKIVTKAGQFFVVAAFAASLLLMSNAALAAEKKAAPQKGSEAKTAEQKAAPAATTPTESGEEYAACSPEFSDEQIVSITQFLKELSPELVPKIRAILLKCDFKVNDDLLSTLTSVQEEMAGTEFGSPEQERAFREEKIKEIEIQMVLTQKPVNQAELKKLVGELFEMRQKGMKSELADLEKQADLLKKRIEERQKLKEQITDRKAKELASGAHSAEEGKEPPQDPLSWD